VVVRVAEHLTRSVSGRIHAEARSRGDCHHSHRHRCQGYHPTRPGYFGGSVCCVPVNKTRREAASRDEARLVSPEERKAWLKQFGKYDSVQLGKDAWLGGKAKGKGKA
jgi:hypothetical protein